MQRISISVLYIISAHFPQKICIHVHTVGWFDMLLLTQYVTHFRPLPLSCIVQCETAIYLNFILSHIINIIYLAVLSKSRSH